MKKLNRILFLLGIDIIVVTPKELLQRLEATLQQQEELHSRQLDGAYQDGFDNGREEGKKLGYEQGFAEGLDVSFKSLNPEIYAGEITIEQLPENNLSLDWTGLE